MSSKSEILSRIKASKPSPIPLPKVDVSIFNDDVDVIAQFKKMLESVGGNVLTATSNKDVLDQIKSLFPNLKNNYTTLNEKGFNNIALETIKTPQELEDLDLLVIEGLFGVAENGAVWIQDSYIPIRVLPFITKHLVIVLNQSDIYLNMHEVYKQLSDKDFDFGVFISGPSKTADIEQSLVIGAQGALSVTVFLRIVTES